MPTLWNGVLVFYFLVVLLSKSKLTTILVIFFPLIVLLYWCITIFLTPLNSSYWVKIQKWAQNYSLLILQIHTSEKNLPNISGFVHWLISYFVSKLREKYIFWLYHLFFSPVYGKSTLIGETIVCIFIQYFYMILTS